MQFFLFAFDLGGDFGFGRKIKFVIWSEDLFFVFGQSVAHDRIVFVGAEQNADGRVFPFFQKFARVKIRVKLHLPDVLMRELADFQINQNKRAQQTVVENEVNVKMIAVNRDAFLAGDERNEFIWRSSSRVDQFPATVSVS